MSRSRKRRPYGTYDCHDSDVAAKRIYQRKLRQRNRAILRDGAECNSQFEQKKRVWWFEWFSKKDHMYYMDKDDPHRVEWMRK